MGGVYQMYNRDQGKNYINEYGDYRLRMGFPSLKGQIQIEGFFDWNSEVEMFQRRGK